MRQNEIPEGIGPGPDGASNMESLAESCNTGTSGPDPDDESAYGNHNARMTGQQQDNRKKLGRDMTTGSIPIHLLNFSIPMLIGNLLQTGYTIVNTIWLGNIVGPDAIGAATVSFPIIFILIALASGATMATTILVSQYYGAKDMKSLERVVGNSFMIALIFGGIFTAGGILSSRMILRMMDTPQSIFDMAAGYLNITLAGFIFTFFSFLITSILRGIGDTKTPLVFMGIGVVMNAILDPLMIIGIAPFPKLGLNGAAYASLISQALAFVIALVYLNLKSPIIALNFRKLRMDKVTSLLIFKIGLPSMVQMSLVSIGSAFIQTFVNSFGATATAAFGAAGRIDSIAFMPAMSFGMASAALTGQNIGARKPERIREVFKWGVIITSAITVVISILVVILPRTLLSMFVQDPGVLDIGTGYLQLVGSTYIFFSIMFVANGIINGAGHTFSTMIFSIVGLWVIRVPFSAILIKTSLGIKGIWVSIVLSFFVNMLISLAYYFSGRWRKPVIRKGVQVR